jgi:hypothetical protein
MKYTVTIIVAIVVVGGAIFFMTGNKEANIPASNMPAGNMGQNPNMTDMKGPIEVVLNAQYGSGQTGKSILTEENGQTKVTIQVTPGPKGLAQPAHIHLGDCTQIPGSIKYNLNDVVDGVSETMLQPPLHFIHGLGTTLINIHKSKAEYGVYSACGDLTPAFNAAMHTGS